MPLVNHGVVDLPFPELFATRAGVLAEIVRRFPANQFFRIRGGVVDLRRDSFRRGGVIAGEAGSYPIFLMYSYMINLFLLKKVPLNQFFSAK
jgi:hypothetical protein